MRDRLEVRAKQAASMRGKTVLPARRAKISAALMGHHVSAETRRKIGERSANRSLEVRQKIARSVAAAHARGDYSKIPTSLEMSLRRLLVGAGFVFEEQVQFGRYAVDAWVSSHKLVFEADGMFWHTWLEKVKPGYHARRDSFLKNHGAVAVIHLTDLDLAPF